MMEKTEQSKNNRIEIRKMIPIGLVISLSLLIGIIISCSTEVANTYRIITFNGKGTYYNFSKVIYGYVVKADSLSSTALLAGNGDIIAIEDEILFINTSSDKKFNLVIKDDVIYNNGKPLIIKFSDKDKLVTWLENPAATDFSGLKSIDIDENMTMAYMPYIAGIAKLQPGIGLGFAKKNEKSDSILSLFDPSWIMYGSFDIDQLEQLGYLKRLEMLGISFNDSLINRPLPKIPTLKHLLLIELKKHTVIDDGFLKNNPQIETVVCSSTEISDFSFIKPLRKLRSLSITANSELSNIEFVRNFRHLESLSLLADHVDNLEPLNDLRELKWVVLYGKFTQQKFNSFIEAHPMLEVVELIDCDSINNIQSLIQLKMLSALVVSDTLRDSQTPALLKNLRYLSLPGSALSDSAYVSNLKKELPGCTVVPNQGFCLGSGWLLLFIPVLLLLTIVKYFSKGGRFKFIFNG